MKADDPRHGTLTGYKYLLCRCPKCARATYRYEKRRKYLVSIGSPPTLPAHGFKRRVHALMCNGWTAREIARELGIAPGNLARKLASNASVRRETHLRMCAIYERLCMVIPSDETPTRRGETRVHARTRGIAIRNGWAPPLAWDDIDDPDEQPSGITNDTGVWADRAAARIAALEDYADQGMTLDGACAELGITDKSLWKWLDRYDRRELYERLASRQRVVENRFTRGAVA